ncbi:MAG: histidinol dehydrogenase [Cardiobacteriaceae bacterium]|nr:histidinol dehydrogenase [Cardiobacteriaceae bacterium]
MTEQIIKIFKTTEENFSQTLKNLLDTAEVGGIDSTVAKQVAEIISDVRQNGDKAVLHYSAKFDGNKAEKLADLQVKSADLITAWNNLDADNQRALQIAHRNVVEYGEKQKLASWSYQRPDGSKLAQKITALDSAGIYVPGGKASYPSSVIMNAAAAQVAGVKRIVMTVPAPNDELNPLVLAAAHLCGVTEVWKIGGAQAVAALAYGTETIAAVDKITGPGNRFVAEAKRQVFGKVGIDMVAGPSEVVVIADKTANPEFIAADLFAQAEHDEMAQSILLCDDAEIAEKVSTAVKQMLSTQPRKEIIEKSLRGRGAIIICRDIAESVEIANYIAPEHLELMTENAPALVEKIRHSGAIFVGSYSNEVFGDYCAGTNHVLPTSRTARFASGLGVCDFQKRTSILELSSAAAQELSPVADLLAQGEGLHAHALSARLRGSAAS